MNNQFYNLKDSFISTIPKEALEMNEEEEEEDNLNNESEDESLSLKTKGFEELVEDILKDTVYMNKEIFEMNNDLLSKEV